MNSLKYFRLVVTIVALFLSSGVKAQEAPATKPEFPVGAFIHSSKVMEYTQYNNYEQIHDMGINSVMQIAVTDVSRLSQVNNLGQLSLFPYVYVGNDSGTGSVPQICDWCNAEEENIDWISYFTHAKYMKWEVEGSQLFSDNVSIKHIGGTIYQESDGTEGWRTDNNQPGDFLIYGPDYWQYPRYTYTNAGWNPTPINYKAVFKMKIDSPSQQVLDVCEISVTMYNDAKGIPETTLVRDTLTTADFNSTGYTLFNLEYDYRDYIDLPIQNLHSIMVPSTITNPFGGIESNPSLNQGSKVQFKVKWLGNKELFVDYIEVFDIGIYETWFINNYNDLETNILEYDQEFQNNPAFYDRLKYYGTIDEPHVIDCFIPLRKVQEILDNNNINADLLTHWYPGWDYKRDGDDTWGVYNALAQPEKIMFWYSPYVTNKDGTTKPRDFTQYWFHLNLQKAHLQKPDYFVTLQAWGWKNIEGGNYIKWMTPTPAEISAETMLALAHGVKGIQ